MSYGCWQFRSGYDAMQLSSGIPGAFSYGCWQFRSDMMLCGCQVAFLRQSAMWAGNLDRVGCYVVGECHSCGSQLCGLAIVQHSAMHVGWQ